MLARYAGICVRLIILMIGYNRFHKSQSWVLNWNGTGKGKIRIFFACGNENTEICLLILVVRWDKEKMLYSVLGVEIALLANFFV